MNNIYLIKSDGRSHVSFCHVPKCGGHAFNMDIREHFNRKDAVVEHELYAKNVLAMTPSFYTVRLIILRSPREHVLSQYVMCRPRTATGHGGVKGGLKLSKNLYDDFGEWVNHFWRFGPSLNSSSHSKNESNLVPLIHDYDCYNPWNMAARYLTSHLTPAHLAAVHGINQPAHHVWDKAEVVPPFVRAIETMERFDIVGIVELYDVVLCVVLFRMEGRLQKRCTCAQRQDRKPVKVSAEAAHHVVAHSIGDVPLRILDQVDTLTRVDARIYAAALHRFGRDVAAAESDAGSSILCPGELDSVKARYSEFIDFEEGEEGDAVSRWGLNATRLRAKLSFLEASKAEALAAEELLKADALKEEIQALKLSMSGQEVEAEEVEGLMIGNRTTAPAGIKEAEVAKAPRTKKINKSNQGKKNR